ncbi:hypothetical protein NQ318_018521 [Aromia moschata]|uniref:Uncharacterized protein n=1 Tax=Aromia moschata TaxID=1265417 RepID=A0AAV8ZHL1_9CUCU|nr:hypothetical protein NQ318_018521 [Aromia moschata]
MSETAKKSVCRLGFDMSLSWLIFHKKLGIVLLVKVTKGTRTKLIVYMCSGPAEHMGIVGSSTHSENSAWGPEDGERDAEFHPDPDKDRRLRAEQRVERRQPLRTHCGSPEYAAPELFVTGRHYGAEVDLWSLSVNQSIGRSSTRRGLNVFRFGKAGAEASSVREIRIRRNSEFGIREMAPATQGPCPSTRLAVRDEKFIPVSGSVDRCG